MPLRKKHVRRIVLVLLFVAVLGPLVGMGLYGLWLRGGGYDAAIEAELRGRLRCHAKVRGARPTGLGSAAADQVELTWPTSPGRLCLFLHQLRAEQDREGCWRIMAATASLRLEGPDPGRSLGALNQRLVQMRRPSRLALVSAERMFLHIETPVLNLAAEGKADAVFEGGRRITVRFWLRKDREQPLAEKPEVFLALDPVSPSGVSLGLWAKLEDVPPRWIWLKTPRRGRTKQITNGTLDLAVDWYWYGTVAERGTVKVSGRDLDLGDWTGFVPGGPMTGKANLSLAYSEERKMPGQLDVRLTSSDGHLSAETLRWLEGLAPTIRGYGGFLCGRIGYERLSMHLRATGDGRAHLAEGDTTVPLVSTRLFGEEVPLLWTGPEPFDATAAWERLRSALLPQETDPPR